MMKYGHFLSVVLFLMFTALVSCSEHSALRVERFQQPVMLASPGVQLRGWDVCLENDRELIYAL
ncbi:MAG: hypothetical protein ACRC3B_07220, partial [Bacteroidia bacterium]